MLTILAVVLLIAIIAGSPALGWQTNYGYGPSLGGVVLLLIVLWLIFRARI